MFLILITPHYSLKNSISVFKFDLISLIGEKQTHQLGSDNLQRGTDGSNLHKELICVSLIAPASQLITQTAMFLVLALHWLLGSYECLQIRNIENDPMIQKRIKNFDENKPVIKNTSKHKSKKCRYKK